MAVGGSRSGVGRRLSSDSNREQDNEQDETDHPEKKCMTTAHLLPPLDSTNSTALKADAGPIAHETVNCARRFDEGPRSFLNTVCTSQNTSKIVGLTWLQRKSIVMPRRTSIAIKCLKECSLHALRLLVVLHRRGFLPCQCCLRDMHIRRGRLDCSGAESLQSMASPM